MMTSTKRKVPYLEIAEELRRKIHRENLSAGTPVMSSRALARYYKVSLSTAHKAVQTLVEEGILYRRQGSGTYVGTQAPDRAKPLVIGCNFRNRPNDRLEKLLFEPEIHAMEYLQSKNCTLRMIPPETFSEGDSTGKSLRGLDGLLISTTLSSLNCPYLQALKIPTVLFQGECEYDLPFHQVLPDQMTGLRAMFRKAAYWKFGSILIVHHDHQNACFRKDICIRAAKEAGYHNIETMLIPQGGNVYKLGLQIARNTRNKLIFTTSDLITFDLIRAFSDAGLQPSCDYHIVGFDNIEGINIRPCPTPIATAISYNREKAAIIAAQLLLSEIRQPSGYTHIIKIPTEFLLRESGLNRKYNSFAETITIQNHSKKGTRT